MSSAGLRSSQGELHQVPELDFSWYQPQDLCTTNTVLHNTDHPRQTKELGPSQMGSLWWSTELNPGLSATELQLQSTTATTSQSSHSHHCLLMQRQNIDWPARTRKHLHRHLGTHKPTWLVLAEHLTQPANNSIYSTKQDLRYSFV